MRILTLIAVLLSSIFAFADKAPRCSIQYVPKCQLGDMEQGRHCVAKLDAKLNLLTDAQGNAIVDQGDDYAVFARGEQIDQFTTNSVAEQTAKLKELVDSGKCAPSKAVCYFRVAGDIQTDGRTTTNKLWVTRGSEETLFVSYPITTNDNDLGSRESRETDVIGGVLKAGETPKPSPASLLMDAKICAAIKPML